METPGEPSSQQQVQQPSSAEKKAHTIIRTAARSLFRSSSQKTESEERSDPDYGLTSRERRCLRGEPEPLQLQDLEEDLPEEYQTRIYRKNSDRSDYITTAINRATPLDRVYFETSEGEEDYHPYNSRDEFNFYHHPASNPDFQQGEQDLTTSQQQGADEFNTSYISPLAPSIT